MIESKLIKTISTFSVSEIGQFRDFVQSPYHNKNKYVIKLAQFLEQQYPEFKPKKTTKASAYHFIFPENEYDDLKIRHLMSMLSKVCEEFLAVKKLKSDPVDVGIKLMDEFSSRGLMKPFNTVKRQMVQAQNGRKRKDLFYYYNQYRLQMVEEQLEERQKGRRKATYLQSISDNLDAFYIINKLKQCCAVFSYQNIFQQDYQLKMVDEILAHLSKNQYDVPLINLYHSGLLTLTDGENENHFQNLKSDLIKYEEEVPLEEAADLHVLARNYSIKQINTGNTHYIRELFDLYKLGLDARVLFDQSGKITPASYKNIVSVGLSLKEFEWTESFIHEYAERLEQQFQHDYLNYNLAKLHFEKQEFDKVSQMLSYIDYKDLFITVDARTLLLKTFYELDEYDLLMAQLDSFKQFISRKKELAYHRSNYLNTIRYIRNLTRLAPGNKSQKEKLRKMIQGEHVLTERNWLLEKVEGL